MRCSQCGRPVAKDARFCVACGASLTAGAAASAPRRADICAACGGSLAADDRFCTRCGRAARGSPHPPQALPQPAGETVEGWARVGRRAPWMVMTAAICFAAHYYLMGMINGGYEYNPGAFRGAKFVLPMAEEVRDPATRTQLQRIQSVLAPVLEPLLPFGEYLMNWKTNYRWNNQPIYFDDQVVTDPTTQVRRVVAGAQNNVPPFWYRIRSSFTNGNFNNSFTIWTMLSLVGWTFLGTLVRSGPIGGVSQVLAQPFRFAGVFLQKRPKDWAALFVGSSLGMLLASGLKLAPEAALSAAIGGAFVVPTAIGVRGGNLIFSLLPGPLKGRRSRSRFSLRSARLLFHSLPAGAGLTWGFGSHPTLAWGLLLAGLALLFSARARRWIGRIRARSAAVAVLALAWWLGMFDLDPAPLLADDGGRAEFGGGTFPEWMSSSGGVEVAIHSATGVLGTALGPLASGIHGPEPLPEEEDQDNQLTSLTITVSEAIFN